MQSWNQLFTELATNPLATHLLTTYGKAAWHTLHTQLINHPYLQDRTTFSTSYHHAFWALILTAAYQDDAIDHLTYRDLAHATRIHEGRIRDWLTHTKEPHLLRTLRIHETARHHWETTLPSEAKTHYIDPSHVYTIFKPLLQNPKHQTPQNIANAIAHLYTVHPTLQPILIAALTPYHKGGPTQLWHLTRTITTHRTTIQTHLNHHLHPNDHHHEHRLACDHYTLYLWHKPTHPHHWLNTYKTELIYLTPTIKTHLLTDAKRHLNTTNQGLGQLLTQLTHHTGTRTHNPRATPYQLTPNSPSLHGETLHLLLNATNTPFKHIQPHITRIGRISNHTKGGGLTNPHFPEQEHLQELQARLIAIALSDCHINRNTHVLTYHENDINRITYVKKLFQKLGDCVYQIEDLAGQRKRLTIAAVIGRLFKHWGIPVGDKHLSPIFRLPSTIRYGSPAIKRAYLEEVIPEEGFFVNRAGAQKFGIKRAAILDAGEKAKMYGFQPLISYKHKTFIQRYGVRQTLAIGNDKLRKRISLTKRQIEKLRTDAETPQDRQLAKELYCIIKDTSCLLLEDEKTLIESLGIKMQKLFKELHLHETGRVSIIWEIFTKAITDTHRWATLAPPAFGEKQLSVQEWMASYQDRKSTGPSKPEGNTRQRMSRIL
jgi:hypothetical protein